MPASEVHLRNYRPFPRSKLQILRVRALRGVPPRRAGFPLAALLWRPGGAGELEPRENRGIVPLRSDSISRKLERINATDSVAPASRRLLALFLIPGSVSRSRHSLARELDSGVAR
jgi:hypothetical protein